MVTIDEVRQTTTRISRRTPGAVIFVSERPQKNGTARITVHLSPTSLAVASELEEEWGGTVDIVVGAMTFPEGILRSQPQILSQLRTESSVGLSTHVPSESASISLTGNTSVSLKIRNDSSESINLCTEGWLNGFVVDPSTEEPVSVNVYPKAPVGADYPIAPSAMVTISCTIGISSLKPSLGYAVPPGHWKFKAILDICGQEKILSVAHDLYVR